MIRAPASFTVTHEGATLRLQAHANWRGAVPDVSGPIFLAARTPAWLALVDHVELVRALRRCADRALIEAAMEASPLVFAIIQGARRALHEQTLDALSAEEGDAAW